MVVGGTKLRVVSLFAAKWLPLQTRSGVGGGLGHLLECLFFSRFLDFTRVVRRRIFAQRHNGPKRNGDKPAPP